MTSASNTAPAAATTMRHLGVTPSSQPEAHDEKFAPGAWQEPCDADRQHGGPGKTPQRLLTLDRPRDDAHRALGGHEKRKLALGPIGSQRRGDETRRNDR